jgi:hypothetical protein
MKLHSKSNIILLGLLIVAILFYFMKSNTLKEGSLASDGQKLFKMLEKGKNVLGQYVDMPV